MSRQIKFRAKNSKVYDVFTVTSRYPELPKTEKIKVLEMIKKWIAEEEANLKGNK